MNFKGKNVLITGGGRGIGQATAQAFAMAGARVAINYRSNHEAAKTTINNLKGGPHLAIQADIGQPDEVKSLVNKTIDEFGHIDILVNNAGVHHFHPIDEVSYEKWQAEWQYTININLIGAANMIYCVAQHMMDNGGGRIVNVSSRGAFRGEPDQPAYGASKAGMNAMCQSLAQKLAPHNIFVGIVAPGFVETDLAAEILNGPKGEGIRNQSPLNRVAKPDEVAKGVLFLAADGTEFMTGAILDINGASYLRS